MSEPEFSNSSSLDPETEPTASTAGPNTQGDQELRSNCSEIGGQPTKAAKQLFQEELNEPIHTTQW